jgi:hypothetical protein
VTQTYLKVDNQPVSGTTSSDDYDTFRIDKARCGVYRINITNVALDGYVFDRVNSATLDVVSKRRQAAYYLSPHSFRTKAPGPLSGSTPSS